MIRLSVLDQSTIVTGRAPAESVRETLALARHCEALGYARYWLAEHHNTQSIAGSAPEVLMAAIAATTRRIRVGSAGVMLPHYSSLKVAEQFRVLEAIAPGRIDLGVCRAPGSDQRTAFALNPLADTAADHFPAQMRDLLAWVRGEELVEGHPFRGVAAQPAGPTAPEVWMLGSSDYGAQVAAYFGLPYCFAHFITDGRGTEQALALYRAQYRPSARHPTPHAALCVWAVAAETEAEAARLFASRGLQLLRRDRGEYVPLPTPEEAAGHHWSEEDRDLVKDRIDTQLVGSPRTVADKLDQLQEATGADELAVTTITHDHADRVRSYQLLADEWAQRDS